VIVREKKPHFLHVIADGTGSILFCKQRVVQLLKTGLCFCWKRYFAVLVFFSIIILFNEAIRSYFYSVGNLHRRCWFNIALPIFGLDQHSSEHFIATNHRLFWGRTSIKFPNIGNAERVFLEQIPWCKIKESGVVQKMEDFSK
jgi:hypothetical protein